MAIARDGVELMCKFNLIPDMIKSFMEYTNELKNEEAKFLIFLLEAFAYILE